MESRHFEKGMKLFQRGRFKLAIGYFRRDVQLNEGHAEGWFYLAKSKFKLGEFEASLPDFDRLISLRPGEAEWHLERGLSRLHIGAAANPLDDFNQAVLLEPGYDYAYACRAFARSRMGDTEGAIIDYERAIELDPGNDITRNNLDLLRERSQQPFIRRPLRRKAPDDIAEQGTGQNGTHVQAGGDQWRKAEIGYPERRAKPRWDWGHFGRTVAGIFSSIGGMRSFVRFLFSGRR